MRATVVDFGKNELVLNITDTSREELENKLNLFFTSEGYKLKSSENEIYTYTKGNRVLRILFGAFVKYFKQAVIIKNEADLFSVKLYKDSSGISGGLIGVRQVKNEFARLSETFKSYFK